MESVQETVVVTGCTGYLGSEVLALFAKSGQFKVIGTVRDPNNMDKLAHVKKLTGEHFDKIEFRRADLLDEASVAEALTGANVIVHTASPFYMVGAANEDELIKPAVEGTMSVMRAAHKLGVRRVVVTASIGCVLDPLPAEYPEEFNESHWTYTGEGATVHAYGKSKTLAEKAGWDYIAALDKEGTRKMDLVTINPNLIVGPTAITSGFSAGAYVKSWFLEKSPFIASKFPIVELTAVAEAHFKAVVVPEAKDKRFILSNTIIDKSVVKAAFAKEFTQYGYEISTEETPNSELKSYTIDNSRSRDVLGIEYTDITKVLCDMVYSMMDSGLIEDDKRSK